MKGQWLQIQFKYLKDRLDNKEGTSIIVDEKHYYKFNAEVDGIYYTEQHGDWELIIDKKIKICDSNCRECKECGLWNKKEYYFIPCSDILRIRLD